MGIRGFEGRGREGGGGEMEERIGGGEEGEIFYMF